MAAAGSTRSAARIASVLASAQISMTATTVNDMFLNEDRLDAPVIAPISNRTVAVSNTLSFNVGVTKDPADSVDVTCASTLDTNLRLLVENKIVIE